MESNGVVPDVIPKAPGNILQITYNSGKLKVDQGNTLTPSDLKLAPEVTWNADSSSYYTLVMTDPDAPSRQNPKAREWRHCPSRLNSSSIREITGSNANGANFSDRTIFLTSNPIFGYMIPGLHRYVLLVYKQPSQLDFEESKSKEWKRNNFSVQKFAQKYKLQDPVAGNFYQAENK
ncbi:hypothetical protein M8J76_011553 [Diaphorina citri]|nr:hypothetical protein M8J76_011553 [Diaphorina citri]